MVYHILLLTFRTLAVHMSETALERDSDFGHDTVRIRNHRVHTHNDFFVGGQGGGGGQGTQRVGTQAPTPKIQTKKHNLTTQETNHEAQSNNTAQHATATCSSERWRGRDDGASRPFQSRAGDTPPGVPSPRPLSLPCSSTLIPFRSPFGRPAESRPSAARLAAAPPSSSRRAPFDCTALEAGSEDGAGVFADADCIETTNLPPSHFAL
jgi:hypothetical protein